VPVGRHRTITQVEDVEEEFSSIEFHTITLVSPERIQVVEAPDPAEPEAVNEVECVSEVVNEPVAAAVAEPEAVEPAAVEEPEAHATPAKTASAAPAEVVQPTSTGSAKSMASTAEEIGGVTAEAAEATKAIEVAEAAEEGTVEEPQQLVLSGEFIKKGSNFPWTWKKRAFEVTVSKENAKPHLSYYDHATKKGSLELGRVRLPNGLSENQPPTNMLLSDELLLQQKQQQKPASTYEVVFEAADGTRHLRALASSEQERKQWLEATRSLLALE